MKSFLVTILLLFLSNFIPLVDAQDIGEETLELYEYVNPEKIIEDIRDIASPAFEGRELGYPGNIKAQNWIIYKFKSLNLETIPEFNNQYTESFDITQYVTTTEQNNLIINGKKVHSDYFSPAYFSASSSIKSNLIHSDSADSYTGFTVVHYLDEVIDRYKFDGTVSIATYYQDKGADAVIFVDTLNSRLHQSGNPYNYSGDIFLPKLIKKDISFTTQPFVRPENTKIPVFYLSHQILNKKWHKSDVEIEATVNAKNKRSASNVLARITGKKYPDQYIIIATYFDSDGIHPERGNPYLGANEHSASISAMLEMIAALKRFEKWPERTLIFAALNGSKRYNSGLNKLLYESKINNRSIYSIIEFHGLGYSLDPKFTTVSATKYNITTEINDTFSKTWKHPFINLVVTEAEANTKNWFDDKPLYNSIPFISISGDRSPFHSRMQDVPSTLNYVQVHRTTQYTIDLLWRLANDN